MLAVLRIDDADDIEHQHRGELRQELPVDEARDETGQRLAGSAAEERRPVGKARLEMLGDAPGIADDLLAVAQDRHLLLPGEGDRLLVADPDRDELGLDPLMGESEPRAPGEQAVAPILEPVELVEDHAYRLTSARRRSAGSCGRPARAARSRWRS